jgi:hypothetical protein
VIKLVAFLRRKPGLSDEEFMRLYETRHAPLAAAHMKGAVRYCRRYVRPMDNHAGGQMPFDVVTEMWVPDQESLDAILTKLSDPRVADAIQADEEELFDRDSIQTFWLEERDSLPSLAETSQS